jgi:hypothetical protein
VGDGVQAAVHLGGVELLHVGHQGVLGVLIGILVKQVGQVVQFAFLSQLLELGGFQPHQVGQIAGDDRHIHFLIELFFGHNPVVGQVDAQIAQETVDVDVLFDGVAVFKLNGGGQEAPGRQVDGRIVGGIDVFLVTSASAPHTLSSMHRPAGQTAAFSLGSPSVKTISELACSVDVILAHFRAFVYIHLFTNHSFLYQSG